MNPYDYVPKSGSSEFLSLKSKGDSINIRLTGSPVREYKVWREGEKTPIEDEKIAKLDEERIDSLRKEINEATGEKKYRVSEQFTWVVIDRDDANSAKVYTGASSVFNKIKAYAQNAKWGDPTKYDFTITRTEQPGTNYYDVMADPSKSELTAAERDDAAQIDLGSIRPFAKSLVASAKADTQVPVAKSADVVLTDIDDEPSSDSLADEL
jgi:hypothetical protein